MKFGNVKEMVDYIKEGRDLYSPSLEKYLFLYNDYGAICTYNVSNEEAVQLKQEQEYWGEYLGIGGWVFNDPLEACENIWNANDWEDVTKW